MEQFDRYLESCLGIQLPSLRFPYHQGLLIFFLMLGHQDFPNLKETSFTIIFICIYYIQHCLITLFPFPSLFHFHHSNSCSTRPPLSSDIIIFTDRPELKAKGERIIFEDREVKKRKFSLRETALFNPDPILAKISRILTEN